MEHKINIKEYIDNLLWSVISSFIPIFSLPFSSLPFHSFSSVSIYLSLTLLQALGIQRLTNRGLVPAHVELTGPS